VKEGFAMSMFCYQCQETARGTGCEIKGVCGKNETVAKLQDLLIYSSKGIAEVITKGKMDIKSLSSVNHEILKSLFMTITNANFDENAFEKKITEMLAFRNELKKQVPELELSDAGTFEVLDRAIMIEKASSVGVLATENEDVRSLRQLVIYGLKGIAGIGTVDSDIELFMS
jgi:hydroxylamine reductase